MKKILLKIKKIKAKANEREILKGVSFQIKRGEIQSLLGPNASGKSTFAQVIIGNPKYKITGGGIFFEGKEVTKFSPERRVKLGMALAWQSPPKIKGVKLSQVLERISQREIEIEEAKSLLEKEVNLDLSGGEKKISELLQVISLNPKLVIFDEIDSGLDIKRLEKVAKMIKKELVDKGVSVLLITHLGQILQFLKPNLTNVMLNGKIICKGRDFRKILRTIKKYDYEKCKKCLSAKVS